MTGGIVTLKERHRREMERMEAAIDAALTAYARENGGRSIRFGSTVEGRKRAHGDIDVIADFSGEASSIAVDSAEDLCFADGMTPDAHAGRCLSAAFENEAERRGLVLS